MKDLRGCWPSDSWDTMPVTFHKQYVRLIGSNPVYQAHLDVGDRKKVVGPELVPFFPFQVLMCFWMRD